MIFLQNRVNKYQFVCRNLKSGSSHQRTNWKVHVPESLTYAWYALENKKRNKQTKSL